MTTTDLATRNGSAELSSAVETALIEGDLDGLDVRGRLALYHQVCADLGLNPRTQPFDYVRFKGREGEKAKLQLYAKRNCTDQLAKNHRLNQEILKVETVGDIYIVHARVTSPDGRSTDNIGAVGIAGKGGDFLANAFKKAVTQAYRRAVLSHVGLSFLDETEVDQVQGAERIGLETEPEQQPSDDGELVRMPSEEARELFLAHEKALNEAPTLDALQNAFRAVCRGGAQALLTRDQVKVLTTTKDACKDALGATE
jgi:hypothetical protein